MYLFFSREMRLFSFFFSKHQNYVAEEDGLGVSSLQAKCEAKPFFMPRDLHTQIQGSNHAPEHCVRELSDVLHPSMQSACEYTLPPIDAMGRLVGGCIHRKGL